MPVECGSGRFSKEPPSKLESPIRQAIGFDMEKS